MKINPILLKVLVIVSITHWLLGFRWESLQVSNTERLSNDLKSWAYSFTAKPPEATKFGLIHRLTNSQLFPITGEICRKKH